MKVIKGKMSFRGQLKKRKLSCPADEVLSKTEEGSKPEETRERKISAGEELTQAIVRRHRRNVEGVVRRRYQSMPIFSSPDESQKPPRAVSFCPEILLLSAVMENNTEELAKILREGNVNVNQANSIGRLPIHEAASEGFVECAQILIENGANLTLECSEGFTPLEAAVISGNFECAELLIRSGAPIDKIKNGFRDPVVTGSKMATDCNEEE
ncbi:hypothetical protein OS493_000960 [Desmophyllum pertusum]|uniref:Uncharacterized protein n=1 Tax=Desmophyllum pertusum TaxID=174260 RepID=A0A9W9ZUB1_9CNID|nr:hypothetical protein OS493_000960 [Desmophyllum pertusum]